MAADNSVLLGLVEEFVSGQVDSKAAETSTGSSFTGLSRLCSFLDNFIAESLNKLSAKAARAPRVMLTATSCVTHAMSGCTLGLNTHIKPLLALHGVFAS